MANKRRGEIKAKVIGRTRKLKLRFQEIAALEEALNKGIFEIAGSFVDGSYRAQTVVLVIAEGLRGAGAEVDDEELGDKIVSTGLAEHVPICIELLSTSLSAHQSKDI